MEHSEETKAVPASTAFIASRVRELRKSRGWSADRLVEELAKYGVNWTRGVLVKLETGHREGVSVAELLGLAATFGVFPLELLPGADSWESMRKAIANLLIDRAAGGEPDYGLVPRTVSLGYALGLITDDKMKDILRVYQAMSPRRNANYEAMKGEPPSEG